VAGHRREGSARTGQLGLCTDLYELRMAESYLRRDMTAPATFSLCIRPTAARSWYVALGIDHRDGPPSGVRRRRPIVRGRDVRPIA
jgi:hypothetical protein